MTDTVTPNDSAPPALPGGIDLDAVERSAPI